MKNSYKISTNYSNNRNVPLNRKSPSSLQTEPSYYNQDILRKDMNSLSSNKDINHIYSKALSKKKKRGVLDMSSPGNKDVLTDTDSEVQDNKNIELINRNMHKRNGCAKLIIEKIESQGPQRNEEYYKFTNQKRYNKINDKYNRALKVNSPTNQMNRNLYNNTKYNNLSNSINYNNSHTIDYNNENGYKSYKPGKKLDKAYLNISDSNLNSYYKINNYSQNRNLTTNSSSKDKYHYINDSNYEKNFNTNYIGKTYIDQNKSYYPNYRSLILQKSTESSVEKGSNSYFIGYKNYNIKRNIYKENELNNPTFSNTEDSYPNKRTLFLKKNLAPNIRQQKTISLYNNYKDLTKKAKINQLINMSNNSKSNKTYLQNKFNEKLRKSIIKIQSFWRGAFIRELMTFVGKLNSFINILSKIFKNHKRQNLCYLIDLLKSSENPPKNKKISIGRNMKAPSLRHKYIFNKDKNDRAAILKNIEKNINHEIQDNTKDENYNNLLKNYNSLMDKYNKLKEEISQNNNKKNEFNNLDIDKNNLEIIDKNKKAFNKLSRKNKYNKEDANVDNGITKNEEIKKKFDIIKPELKEEFNIISNNNSNKKLRSKNVNKKIPYKIERISQINFQNEINNNNEDKEIIYEQFLNHFKSNIEINNNDRFIIDETPNINKKELNQIPFDITNNSFTLINEINKENIKEKEEQQKKFENISINKNENGELTIINISKKKEEPNLEKKEVPNTEMKEELSESKEKTKESKSKKKKKKNKNLKLVTENQMNLNTEIKGFDRKKQKLLKDFIIHKNNKIDILQSEKQREFDKEKISPKNDISLNIINEKKDTDANNNDKIKDNNEEKKKEFTVEKNEEILLSEEKNENKKSVEVFMIENNNILYIKRKKKIKCDKITEITEELNKIEPHNHYELVFKGKINLNENFDKNQENKKDKDKPQEERQNISKEDNKNNGFNKGNEVQKGDGIEINPLEFKKTNPNNIIISYENKIEVLYNKNANTFTEKAKRNMMKIILPIRLKTVLRGYIRRIICPLIIKREKTCK